MRRESLWNLKTLDDINTADDISRVKDVPTLSTLSGIEENTPTKLDDKAVEMALARDRQRLTRRMQAIERSQQKLLNMRSKLKATKLRNQLIQNQRKTIMKQRRQRQHCRPPAASETANEIQTAAGKFGLVVTY